MIVPLTVQVFQRGIDFHVEPPRTAIRNRQGILAMLRKSTVRRRSGAHEHLGLVPRNTGSGGAGAVRGRADHSSTLADRRRSMRHLLHPVSWIQISPFVGGLMDNRAAERPAAATSPSPLLADIYVPEVEAVDRMAVERFLLERGYQPRCGDALMAPGPEILAEAIGSAAVVAVALGNVDATVMDADPDLRLIVKCGIGVDCIDVEAARERDIPVIRMGGVNFNGVAEWVIGAVIANLRRFVALDHVVRAGEWRAERDRWTGLLPGLPGRTLGLFGVGSIGSRIAELARVHGMHVIGYDPYLGEASARHAGVELVERDALFERSDVVSVHAILTDETHHAISTAELELMRESAILVNSARGPIVDEAALIEALGAGTIAGAALDVFEFEPVASDSPLLTMDNCLLSPHLAGCTENGYHELGGLAAQLIDDFVHGVPIPANCVVVAGRDLLVAHDAARSH